MIIFFFDPVFSQTEDLPNLDLEDRFHDIYLKHYIEKTSTEQWSQALGSGAKENYIISPGDNLWNISITLFGDGHFWPKIWSINQGISNPHQIEPNDRIAFVLGSDAAAPSITAIGTGDSESAGLDEKNGSGETEELEIEIPPPAFPVKKLTNKIPPSLPSWHLNEKKYRYDSSGISYARRTILDVEDHVFFHSYISEGKEKTVGEIEEGERGSQMASLNQYIYVKMIPGQGKSGDSFLVVFNRGQMDFKSKYFKGTAYNIEVQGEVVLTDVVRQRRVNEKFELFRAIITKVVNPITPGGKLIVGKVQNVSLSREGPVAQVVAQIVGGGLFSRRQLYGVQSLVYLDKGTKAGIKVGQILPIRANRELRLPGSDVELNMRIVGRLRVVKTSGNLATGIVIETQGDIFTGDLTGTGMTKVTQQARSEAATALRVAQQKQGNVSSSVPYDAVEEDEDFEDEDEGPDSE